MDKGQGSHSALPINGNFLKSLNNDPSFKYYLTGNFKKPSKEVLKMYDCLSRKGVPSPRKDTVEVVSDSLLVVDPSTIIEAQDSVPSF